MQLKLLKWTAGSTCAELSTHLKPPLLLSAHFLWDRECHPCMYSTEIIVDRHAPKQTHTSSSNLMSHRVSGFVMSKDKTKVTKQNKSRSGRKRDWNTVGQPNEGSGKLNSRKTTFECRKIS